MNSPQGSGNPSPYQLPQYVSEDRRRARKLTVLLKAEQYPLAFDPGLPENPEVRLPPATAPWPGRTKFYRLMSRLVSLLPPKELFLSDLPPESRFTWPKFFRHGTHAGSMKLRIAYARMSNLDLWPQSPAAYERLLNTIPPPLVKNRWHEDEEFARQRLAGVNPMAIQRCVKEPSEGLAIAANRFLSERHQSGLNQALDAGRLYMTEYPMLWDRPVQDQVRRGACLAAPTCLFYVDDRQTLMPVAIQLKPSGVKSGNPVFTPLNAVWDWRMARAHVQASDSHYHESISHLLETHLVSEIFAVATHRNLHPDHPLYQLLLPHFEHTLAINEQARRNLLASHGEIARCMAAQHTGNINLVRMAWSDWKYQDRNLLTDLESRDVGDLPGYLYRDDSLKVYEAIAEYVRGILGVWYQKDEDVHDDLELQSWAQDISNPHTGQLRGFPAAINTREELFDIATNVVFRASAQHAAVNNGQFGAYGWVPNAPVAVYRALPAQSRERDAPMYTEQDYYASLPNRAQTFGQIGMVWLLSEPTERSLLRAGETPAFSRDHCYPAYQAVSKFRRKLRAISDAIDGRNDEIGFEYNYLKPQNIDHSISI